LKTPFAGYLPVELALLDALNVGDVVVPAPQASATAPATAAKPSRSTTAQQPRQQKPAARSAPKPSTPAPQKKTPPRRTSGSTPPPAKPARVEGELGDVWRQLLRALRPINPKLQALLRSGEPVALQGGDFYIRFRYEFHQNQVRASIDDLNRALSQVLGRPMNAVILGENDSPPSDSADPVPNPDPDPDTDSQSPADETPTSSLADHPVVRRAVDKWGGEIEGSGD
jgi:hypothetical protein